MAGHRLFRGGVAGAVLGLLLLNGAEGHADWPMPRQSSRRTASSGGHGDIALPVPFWRYFVGGSMVPTGAMALDVDGDGTREVVLLTGGRVTARRAHNNDVVWETDVIDAVALVGAADLNGDGALDLVARSNQQVLVLRVTDGQIVWSEPEGEMGTLSAVRIADFDGDGTADLLALECGCCSINSNHGGFAYRFAGPGAALTNPQLLWALDSIPCGGARANAAVHMRDGGASDVVLVAPDRMRLGDGASGTIVAESPVLGSYLNVSRCLGADLLGSSAEELVCVMSNPTGSAGEGHRAFMLQYADGPPRLEVLWQTPIGAIDGQVVIPPSMLSDLNGDGNVELVLGGKESEGADWSTYVLDSQSGQLLGTIPGRPAGTAPLAANRAVVLVNESSQLAGWSYDPLVSPQLQPLFGLPGRTVVETFDFAKGVVTILPGSVLTYDYDGDGNEELVTVPATEATDLSLHQIGPDPPVLASYALPAGASVASAWTFDALAGQGHQLAVAQSDGNLHVLDTALEPVSGNPEFGVRFGSYFSPGTRRQLNLEPVIANVGSGAAVLLVPTSRGAIARLDASEATFAHGPITMWERARTSNGIVVSNLAPAGAGIAAVENTEVDHHTLVALNLDGAQLWSFPLGGIALSDLALAQLDGDGVPDLFLEWGDPNDAVARSVAVSGLSGLQLWQGPEYGPGNRQPSGVSAGDWDGDGIEDIVLQWGATRVIDGGSGAEVLSSPPGWDYFMPILDDVDGDGVLEATLYGGFWPARTLDHDLQSELWVGPDDKPINYGALVRCEDEPFLVGGASTRPSLLKIVKVSGATAGATQELVLAGGKAFVDEDSAKLAGAKTGQLSSPAVHQDLAGDGRAVAVVGSTDGWLYGVDPCAAGLVFAVDLGAQVGSVVFGDSDGDALDEIIVSASDGFLYGLDAAVVAPVEQVIDTDPPHDILYEDVDMIETVDALHASWAQANTVDSYEVAVVRDQVDGGGFISSPPWVDVGAGTTATVGGLPLEDGHRYFIAVRAVANGIRSPDRLSDGVVVTLTEPLPPDPPDAGGGRAVPENVLLTGRSCVYFCAMREPAGRSLAWLSPALLLALFWLRRHGRRR